jgi:DNA repair exonuclease SbcCD ATPase subunit
MKLLTARVRHYRIVRDSGLLRFDSPSGLAILAAPNESGKSTLIEAIHTCLFVAHRTGGEGFLGSIRTKPGTGEHPEVELSFEAGGGKYSLRKVFKGGRTSVAELTLPSGTMLTGEDAERKLAELTGHAPGNAAGREQAWAHLWVWQGTAGDDPLGESLPKDRLDQRLAREGAGGVLRSETDSRVMAQVEELWEQVYTANNRVKVASELHRAAESLAEARNRQAQATAELSRMEADIVAKEDVLRRLEEARIGLERVEPEWERNQQQVATLGDLRQQHAEAQWKLESAATALASLVRADRDIVEKQDQAAALRLALEPAEREVQDLMEQVRASEARQKELSADTKRLAEIEEAARLKRELAQACAELLDREKNLVRLEALQADAETLGAEMAGLEEQLAGLPPVDDRALGRLQDLEKRWLLAEASLKAMALELEVVRADRAVSLSGTPVAPGTTALVTSKSELTVGDGVVIRLSPGGADTLAQTGQEVERARCALAEALGKCQVESLAIAARVREQRAELEARLAGARRQHKALGVEKLAQDLGEARKLKAASQAEKERRLALAPGCAIPAGNEEIAGWLQASKDEERRAQAASHQVNHEFQVVTDRVTLTRERWGTAKEALNKNQAKLLDLTGGISELLGQHGDTEQRRRLLGEAQALHLGMGTVVQTLQDQIAALNPETLEGTTNRLKRSREQLAGQLDEANRKKAELDGKLSAFLSTDPRADVVAGEQRVRVLEAEHRSKQVRAAGIQLLREEFQRAAHEVGQEVVRPLLERVNRLVRIVYGHGAELQIAETGENLGGLHLRRPDRGLHAFSELSTGTREQVAGIFRLALAELLAADHDGCLPMVLDDSFVNADPERMQRLHALLDAAASSGLQVILVTCDPLAHTTLGAQQVDLSAVSRNLQPGVYAVSSGPGGDSPDQAGSDGDNDANTIAMSSVPGVGGRRRKRGDSA